MRDILDFGLIYLLPFWKGLFQLVANIAWPVAFVVVLLKSRNLIERIFSDRGLSFEGFGAHFKVDERKNAQSLDTNTVKPIALGGNLQLPRTAAIDEEEKKLSVAIEEIPEGNRDGIILNALAIERLEKHFSLIYINIFGSQILFLQKINENGGIVNLSDGQEFFSEIKIRFSELSDWDFAKYTLFLVSHGLIVVTDKVMLTATGKDFIQFVVRYGLRTDKPL